MKCKVNSQRGASLSFALMLFLVCAVVGAIVLSAGMAAAGRVAKLAEADQRYYSVMSAAKLFQSEFGEKKVTVDRIKSYTHEVSTVLSDSFVYGDESVTDTDVAYSVKIDGGTAQSSINVASISDMLQYFACKLVMGNAASLEDAWSYSTVQEIPESETVSRELTISVDGKPELEVKAVATLLDGGYIQIDFSNTYKGKPAKDVNVFTVRAIMTPDFETPDMKTVSSSGDTTTSKVGNTTTETVKTQITETKTTSVTWRIGELNVLRSDKA